MSDSAEQKDRVVSGDAGRTGDGWRQRSGEGRQGSDRCGGGGEAGQSRSCTDRGAAVAAAGGRDEDEESEEEMEKEEEEEGAEEGWW